MNRLTTIRAKYIVELTLGILGVIALYLLLANFAPGGPISTDVIGYANVSLNGLKTPTILNRYFHIFLQAIFIKLAPTPLVGLQYFWAFLIAATCGLTYLAARIFTRHSQALHGLLAVVLLLSITDLANTAGIALVDITAMFMMVLFIVLVVISARRGHRSVGLVIALGFLLYLTFRTKETALLAGISLLGLGMTGENPFKWKLFFQKLLYVFIGVLLGIIFFIILNTIFLRDPLFGFRIADFQVYFHSIGTNIFGTEEIAGSENWFTAYLYTGLLIPFSLYLISASKTAREYESIPGMRMVWLIPLAVIIFLTVSVSKGWGFVPRYIYTIFPVICFLAPQFLNLTLPATSNKKSRLWAILIFVIGLLLIPIVRLGLRFILPHLGWDIMSFLVVVFIPVLLAIILGLVFYWKQPPLLVSILIFVLVIAIVTIPLVNNGKIVIRDHPNLNAAQNLFYPFSIFSDRIQYTPGMHMYVTKDTWNTLNIGAYAKDVNEISALFNIYFAVGSDRTNFTYRDESTNTPKELLSTDYNYALLSLNEWITIEQDQNVTSQLEQKYLVYTENENRVVLLKLK